MLALPRHAASRIAPPSRNANVLNPTMKKSSITQPLACGRRLGRCGLSDNLIPEGGTMPIHYRLMARRHRLGSRPVRPRMRQKAPAPPPASPSLPPFPPAFWLDRDLLLPALLSVAAVRHKLGAPGKPFWQSSLANLREQQPAPPPALLRVLSNVQRSEVPLRHWRCG